MGKNAEKNFPENFIMNVDEVGIMIAGESKPVSTKKSKPSKGKLKKWFHNNPTYVACFLCTAFIAVAAIFAMPPVVKLIKGMVNAGAKAASDATKGPRENDE